MSLLVCGNRRQTDKFSSAKSIGQFSLAASLIADDIKDLYSTVTQGEDKVDYFWALVVIIGISLLLQWISMIFALILFFHRYPKPRSNDTSATNTAMEMEAHETNVGNGNPGDGPAEGVQNLEIRYDGAEDMTDPIPPIALKRMNDGLTVIAVLVAILHFTKNALQKGSIEEILEQ